MVTGYLRTTSTNNLRVPAKKKKIATLRRKQATTALASRTKEPNHLLHERLHFRLTVQLSHLNQFVPAALELLQDLPLQGATAN